MVFDFMKTRKSYCIGVLKPIIDRAGPKVWHYTHEKDTSKEAKKALRHHPDGILIEVTRKAAL